MYALSKKRPNGSSTSDHPRAGRSNNESDIQTVSDIHTLTAADEANFAVTTTIVPAARSTNNTRETKTPFRTSKAFTRTMIRR